MSEKGTREGKNKLRKILSYCALLIQEIDEIQATKDSMTQDLFDKAVDLQKALEPIVEGFYASGGVSRSIEHLELERRIEYVVNKMYKE